MEYQNMRCSEKMLTEGKLAEMLESGWELVTMVPYIMQPRDGETYVREYWVTLRRPRNQAK